MMEPKRLEQFAANNNKVGQERERMNDMEQQEGTEFRYDLKGNKAQEVSKMRGKGGTRIMSMILPAIIIIIVIILVLIFL